MTDKTREAFEAWFTSPIGTNFLTRKEDAYTLISAQTGWIAWQAATLAERERCAKVCEKRWMGDMNREDQEARNCAADIRKGGEA